jgi:hypothetical protein
LAKFGFMTVGIPFEGWAAQREIFCQIGDNARPPAAVNPAPPITAAAFFRAGIGREILLYSHQAARRASYACPASRGAWTGTGGFLVHLEDG